MKSLNFLWHSLLILAMLLASCGEDSIGDSAGDDDDNNDPPTTEVEVTLEDLDPENPPTETTWVVTNDTITTSEDFDTLREALVTAAAEEQEVELVFASLESMPEGSFADCEELTSISLPAATTIGESAFSGCVALTTISVPVVEEVADNAFNGCESLEEIILPSTKIIGSGAFASCNALSSLSLATDVKLEAIAADAFSSMSVVSMTRSSSVSITLTITLTISSLNWEYISGNTLTVGDFSEEFLSIEVLGLSDMEIQSPSINDWDKIELQ